MIRLGNRGWELHPGWTCRDCVPFPGLRDRQWAQVWIRQFLVDPLTMSTIRNFLTAESTAVPLVRMTDHEAVDQIADLLSNGKCHAHGPALKISRGSSQRSYAYEERKSAEIFTPARQTRWVEPAKSEDEGGSLSPIADEEVIAAVLKRAAAQGIPFCEECEKATRGGRGGVHA